MAPKSAVGLPLSHCEAWSAQSQSGIDGQVPWIVSPEVSHSNPLLASAMQALASTWSMPQEFRRPPSSCAVGLVDAIGDNCQGAAVRCQQQATRQADATIFQNSRVTVMLRNLPEGYNSGLLLNTLDSHGFAGMYDFVYLPINFDSLAGLGYAFVNLVSHGEALRFWRHFEGFSQWSLPCAKACSLTWSDPHQGLAAHVERYRNSPVMHDMVPLDCKPMIFFEGRRVQFPPPTKSLKAPRMRTRPCIP